MEYSLRLMETSGREFNGHKQVYYKYDLHTDINMRQYLLQCLLSFRCGISMQTNRKADLRGRQRKEQAELFHSA